MSSQIRLLLVGLVLSAVLIFVGIGATATFSGLFTKTITTTVEVTKSSTEFRTQTIVQTQTQTVTQLQTIKEVEKLKPVSLLLGSTSGPRYAHYYVAKGLGFYAKEGLDVTIIKGQGDRGEAFAASQVDAKKVEFGDTGISNIYLNNAKGGKIRLVLNYQETSPLAVVLWKEYNPLTPNGLEGLRFADSPSSGVIPALKALMPVYRASFDKVIFTPVDTAAQRPLFLRGEVDFIPSSWTDDKPVLEREAAKIGREVVHYLLADWGYKVYGSGVVVHEDTIQVNRDLVERFVRATIQGVQAMKENPERAADLVSVFEPGLVRELVVKAIQNRARLDSVDFKVTDGRVKETVSFIEEQFKPDKKIAPEEIWDFSFIQRR